jgi:hypothetical protein
MRKLWRVVDLIGFSLRGCGLGLIGHRRIKLDEWPDRGVVAATIDTVNELGGKRVQKDVAFGFDDVFYFRVQGHQVRLVVEEYGDVSLWGAKGIVSELSERIREKLSANGYESGPA